MRSAGDDLIHARTRQSGGLLDLRHRRASADGLADRPVAILHREVVGGLGCGDAGLPVCQVCEEVGEDGGHVGSTIAPPP